MSDTMETDNLENTAVGTHIKTVKSKDELPNSIIVTQIPEEVFNDPQQKKNFCELFTQIEEDIHFDFLKSFRRIRIIFSTPENATAAKLIVQHCSFNGTQLKAFFAQKIILRNSSALLSPPPLEKQFLISPPCSPPVGWEQTTEMAPIVCSFDLMARLAAFAVDEEYKVHSGDTSHPSIVVSPCETPVDAPAKIEMPHTPRPGTPADSTGEE